MLSEKSLRKFIGSENLFYDKMFPRIKYTEGVKYVRDNGANWLVVLIMSLQPHLYGHDLLTNRQFWTLRKGTELDPGLPDAVLTLSSVTEGVDFSHNIIATDFPFERFEEDFKIWLFDNVMLLPREY